LHLFGQLLTYIRDVRTLEHKKVLRFVGWLVGWIVGSCYRFHINQILSKISQKREDNNTNDSVLLGVALW
jgi:hypothetical protein